MTRSEQSIGITLTGADEATPLAALEELLATFPALEIGILYSATPEGRPRYPSRTWIEQAASRLPGRCALHVCGGIARHQMQAGDLDSMAGKFRRVQFNGAISPAEVHALAGRVGVLITQWQPGRDTLELAQAIAEASSATGMRHQWLVDGSGGRGRLPSAWTRPHGSSQVGYAGGLGPDTLAHALPAIAAIATGQWWVDMENSLRVDDLFNLDRCRAALDRFTAWQAQSQAIRPRPAP